MNTQSTYAGEGLGKWNWGKIGNVISDVSNTVSSFTGGGEGPPMYNLPVLNTQPSHYTSNQPPQQQAQQQQTAASRPAWLLPVAIGGGVLGIIGITTALVNH
jgi:hypothetical protein